MDLNRQFKRRDLAIRKVINKKKTIVGQRAYYQPSQKERGNENKPDIIEAIFPSPDKTPRRWISFRKFLYRKKDVVNQIGAVQCIIDVEKLVDSKMKNKTGGTILHEDDMNRIFQEESSSMDVVSRDGDLRPAFQPERYSPRCLITRHVQLQRKKQTWNSSSYCIAVRYQPYFNLKTRMGSRKLSKMIQKSLKDVLARNRMRYMIQQYIRLALLKPSPSSSSSGVTKQKSDFPPPLKFFGWKNESMKESFQKLPQRIHRWMTKKMGVSQGQITRQIIVTEEFLRKIQCDLPIYDEEIKLRPFLGDVYQPRDDTSRVKPALETIRSIVAIPMGLAKEMGLMSTCQYFEYHTFDALDFYGLDDSMVMMTNKGGGSSCRPKRIPYLSHFMDKWIYDINTRNYSLVSLRDLVIPLASSKSKNEFETIMNNMDVHAGVSISKVIHLAMESIENGLLVRGDQELLKQWKNGTMTKDFEYGPISFQAGKSVSETLSSFYSSEYKPSDLLSLVDSNLPLPFRLVLMRPVIQQFHGLLGVNPLENLFGIHHRLGVSPAQSQISVVCDQLNICLEQKLAMVSTNDENIFYDPHAMVESHVNGLGLDFRKVSHRVKNMRPLFDRGDKGSMFIYVDEYSNVDFQGDSMDLKKFVNLPPSSGDDNTLPDYVSMEVESSCSWLSKQILGDSTTTATHSRVSNITELLQQWIDRCKDKLRKDQIEDDSMKLLDDDEDSDSDYSIQVDKTLLDSLLQDDTLARILWNHQKAQLTTEITKHLQSLSLSTIEYWNTFASYRGFSMGRNPVTGMPDQITRGYPNQWYFNNLDHARSVLFD